MKNGYSHLLKRHGRKKTWFLIFVSWWFVQTQLIAQTYNYQSESFEENVWSIAPSSSSKIAASTGTWTVARSNVQSKTVSAQDGQYSLYFANKGNGLITPYLDNGAGVLTYHVMKTSSRIIMVSTSTDMVNWSSLIDSFVVTSSWTQRKVTINNYNVKYIRFQTNSNGGTYIDNVSITASGAQGVIATTEIPTLITQTSALANGVVTTGENVVLISRGFCYNTTGNPDTSSYKVIVSGASGSFSGQINNFSMGTTYYLKAYAITDKGVSYGLVVSFTTRAADAPVTYWTQSFNDLSQFPSTQPTSPVSIDVSGQGTWIYYNAYKSTNPLYISDGSATCLRMLKNGSYLITPTLNDGVTTVSLYEGRGERDITVYTSTNNGSTWALLGTVTSAKGELITISVNKLNVNRIKIANISGSDADIDNITISVFPNGTTPSLTTSAISNIGKNSATTGGEVVSAGSKSVLERGVCWSSTTTPIIADHKILAETSEGAFTIQLTGLPAGTDLRVRAYATSRAGTGYGNEQIFKTLPPTLPVISTVMATSVKGEYAYCGGTILDNGGAPILEAGVCWNTVGDPSIQDNKASDSLTFDSYQCAVLNLKTETKYYYRAYAITIAGISYGEVDSMTTGTVWSPAVMTSEISSVLFYKATSRGMVTDDGNAITTRGFCWSESENPSISDSSILCGSGPGPFEGVMKNLKENTLYYTRAYAINSVDTVYGNVLTFATPVSNKLTKPIGHGEGTTGGGTPTSSNTVTVKTAAELALALTGDKSVILVSGTITTGRMSAVVQDKTIIGLPGAKLINLDQTADGSGILHLLEGSRNVIIQNLTFEGPGAYDNDGWDLLTNKGCNKLWVDHCDFQDGTDDCFDNTNLSDSITVSWCKFSYLKPPVAGGSGGSADHRFANLIGGSDSDAPSDGHYSITWQNCWWTQGCVSRMVRGRNTDIHILNCYWNSQVATSAIGLTAGTNGSTCYVEGGVFGCTGGIADISSGSIAINFVNCIGGGTNVGVVTKPPYEYLAMTANQVVAVITDASCSAGATLMVTTRGEVFSNCPTTPILSSTDNLNQVVTVGDSISNIVLTWGGTATDLLVTNLPAGLTCTKDTLSQTLTISGIPSTSATFTVSTIGGSGLPAIKSGVITLTDVLPPTMTHTGSLDQIVSDGSPITETIFTWGGGASDVALSSLPKGLTASKDTSTKTLIISGTPLASGSYTVTTIGGTGNVITLIGKIGVRYTAEKRKIAYVTNKSIASYINDNKIYPALVSDPNFDVTEVSSSTAGNDYNGYDLVILSEVANSADAGVLDLKGVDKPFIMMKVHAYKSETGCWSWTSSSSAFGQSATETKVSVTDTSHIIFKDVTWTNSNEVKLLTNVSNLKGITYMDPASFNSVSGGSIKTLAYVKGEPSQISIFEISAGTTISGTFLPKPFIQIGINSASYANVTEDGVSIVKNACLHLLGLLKAPVSVKNIQSESQHVNIYDFKCCPSITDSKTAICFKTNRAGQASLIAMNVNGKTVFHRSIDFVQGSNTISMNLDGLVSGLYIIKLQTEDESQIQKMIVK